jgi:hypothetical protein
MLKVLVISIFYLHLSYGAPKIYTFNFTDMPSSIHLNFNVKPGKTVGPEGTIKPVVTIEPKPGIDGCKHRLRTHDGYP